MNDVLNAIKTRWHEYWFSEEPVIGLALFRIALGMGALLFHIPRFPYIRDLYTNAGFMWPAQLTPWLPSIIQPLSTSGAYAANLTLLAALVFVVIGYKTRLAAFVAFLLHTYLVLLEQLTANSITQAISIYLLLLAISRAGDFLSLDAKLRFGAWAPITIPTGPAAVRLLMVWQLAAIYISNSLLKFENVFHDWLSGDIIIGALKDTQWSQSWAWPLIAPIEPQFAFLVRIAFSAYALLGPALLFRATRPFAIAFGLSWHWVTLAFTTISPAWLAWISIYIVAVEPTAWLTRLEAIRNRTMPAWKLVLAALFIAFFIVSAAQGRSSAFL